jgi:integrase
MNQLVPFRSADAPPALVAAAGGRAQERFIEFFTANIRNRNTRRAYAQAVGEFLVWCEKRRVPSIIAVQPVHVAGYIEELTRTRSAPTAKQRLSAIRHLFDWLVVGHVMPANPASSVRGPSHVVKRGKIPVLSPEEARRVLDAIDVSTHAGLRDRALIALMVFSFARIGAALRREGQMVGIGTFLKLGALVMPPALLLARRRRTVALIKNLRTKPHARSRRGVALSDHSCRWGVAGVGATHERCSAQRPHKSVAGQPDILPSNRRLVQTST